MPHTNCFKKTAEGLLFGHGPYSLWSVNPVHVAVLLPENNAPCCKNKDFVIAIHTRIGHSRLIKYDIQITFSASILIYFGENRRLTKGRNGKNKIPNWKRGGGMAVNGISLAI